MNTFDVPSFLWYPRTSEGEDSDYKADMCYITGYKVETVLSKSWVNMSIDSRTLGFGFKFRCSGFG